MCWIVDAPGASVHSLFALFVCIVVCVYSLFFPQILCLHSLFACLLAFAALFVSSLCSHVFHYFSSFICCLHSLFALFVCTMCLHVRLHY